MPLLLLFDTTPGDAGNTIRIGEHLEAVAEEALSRVGACECGPESSRYACLRTFQNERFHESPSHREAVALLHALTGGHGLGPCADRRVLPWSKTCGGLSRGH
ncbi:DUF1998 domain-containing protein [Streptomyces sp. NPDC050388]|uniref:DUF1998 domain-containing protein n=1 Tax=Streptomyces sp. NPDC050388 TaxID=3155781 RepID=UPI00343D5E0F